MTILSIRINVLIRSVIIHY